MLSDDGHVRLSPVQIQQVVRITWNLAAVEPSRPDKLGLLSDTHLLELWSATRTLSQTWLARLGENSAIDPAESLHDFRRLASEILVADMFLRVHCTVLACSEVDRCRSQISSAAATREDFPQESEAILELPASGDARPVLDRAFDFVNHARTRVLQALVDAGEPAAEVDRLRRRCERWADSLIGCWLVQFGVSAFAHDPRRAWDFGEDALGDEAASRLLLRHSYLAAFRDPLLDSEVASDGWSLLFEHARTLTQSNLIATLMSPAMILLGNRC
ncbi:MAG: hypothetical protein B7Z55_03655 [Planctomycetales bacterium 12-60-4]|nr:MAG: hypothetical protein B7Z55_03655 [Planctomycetales bacterium 12-60-4]